MMPSSKIKQDAEALLAGGLHQLMSRFGDVIYTGSYALDLMVWNDIDLYIVPGPEADWNNCAAQLIAELALRPEVESVDLKKALHKKRPDLPKGICIGAAIPQEGYKLPWKLDIWLVEADVRERNREMMDRIRARLTEKTRQIILNAKTALINSAGRTPPSSGVAIYLAVLEQGIESIDTLKAMVLEQKLTERLDELHPPQ